MIFQDAIDALYLLFFAQLKAVADDFGFAIMAVLSWREVPLFDAAGRFEAPFAFQKELHAFSTAQPAYRSYISSQTKLSFSSGDGTRYVESVLRRELRELPILPSATP